MSTNKSWPKGFKKKHAAKPADFRVRCLGPKASEHYFYSTDPLKHRVCPACRRRQDDLNLSVREAKPLGSGGAPIPAE